MRIVIYGGSFNPPHVSHLIAIQTLIGNFDQVWIIPSYKHAFDKKMADFDRRVEMLNLTLDGINPDKFKICEIEREKPELIYTYDVLCQLEQDYPEHTFTFCVGSDNLTESYRWYKFEELIMKWEIYVFRRYGHDGAILEFQQKYEGKYKNLIVGPKLPKISSSEIRATLSQHGSKNDLIAYMMPDCLALIKAIYSQPDVMLFGFGKAGQAIKSYLEEYESIKVGIWSRKLQDLPSFEEIKSASIWLICVSDDSIQEVSDQLYQKYAHQMTETFKQNFLIGHISGLHSDQKLTPWVNNEYDCVVLHPLQALRDANSAKDLENAYFSVTLKDQYKDKILKKLRVGFARSENRFMILNESQRDQYHLSATFTSNLSLILVGIGINLLKQVMNSTEKEAREKLMPLLRSTMLRLEMYSVEESATGAIARKDLSTIKKHLDYLTRLDEDISPSHLNEIEFEPKSEISRIREIYEKILLFSFRKDQEMLMKLNLE
jgi:nicotinate-nucleotide adenylyltransferase